MPTNQEHLPGIANSVGGAVADTPNHPRRPLSAVLRRRRGWLFGVVATLPLAACTEDSPQNAPPPDGYSVGAEVPLEPDVTLVISSIEPNSTEVFPWTATVKLSNESKLRFSGPEFIVACEDVPEATDWPLISSDSVLSLLSSVEGGAEVEGTVEVGNAESSDCTTAEARLWIRSGVVTGSDSEIGQRAFSVRIE